MGELAVVGRSNFFQNRWQILLLSALIGVIFISPHIYLRTVDAGYFTGVDILGSDAETHYVARIQEVYDGHPELGSTYLWEGKGQPYLTPPFLEIATANLGRILYLNAIQINIFSKFLFGFLLSLLLYFFVLELFGDTSLALLSSALTLLAPSLLSSTDLRSVFSWEINNLAFLQYARPVNPVLSSLFLFGYLFFLHRLVRYARIKDLFYGSVLLGLSFYAYVYFWTYLVVVNSLIVLWLMYQRNWAGAKKIILVSIGAVVIALPYLIHTAGIFGLPGYQEASGRLGFYTTHALMVSKLVVITAGAVVLAYVKKLPSFNVFFVITLVASFLIINHQVVTGKNIQNAHYHWYVVTPLAGMAILSTLYFYAKRFFHKKFFNGLAVFCLTVFFAIGLITQAKSYFSLRSITIHHQRYARVLAWLNQRTPGDSVVFANDTLSELIPAYTHANVYHSAYTPYYLNSQMDLQNRFFLRLYFSGITSDRVRAHLNDHRDETAYYLFGLTYRYTYTANCSACFPDEINAGLAQAYAEFLEDDFLTLAKKYRLDYVVWDKSENPDWQLPKQYLNSVFEDDNLVVFGLS